MNSECTAIASIRVLILLQTAGERVSHELAMVCVSWTELAGAKTEKLVIDKD